MGRNVRFLGSRIPRAPPRSPRVHLHRPTTRTAPEATDPGAAPPRGGATWIDDWRPEDPAFWEAAGRPVARRNLVWSIFAEHLGFSVWLLWSVSAALLLKVGLRRSPPQQLFLLVARAEPGRLAAPAALHLRGAAVRRPQLDGRQRAAAAGARRCCFAWSVQHPETPYWVFCLIAATAGLGGGNFASSMANINFFYPTAKKGTALGLNAAGGNIGVAFIQLFLPIVVGGAGVFGLVKASERRHRTSSGPATCTPRWPSSRRSRRSSSWTTCTAREVQRRASSCAVVQHQHTWVMSFLYIGTFGSFIGYSAAMPLLIKLNFSVPDPAAASAPASTSPTTPSSARWSARSPGRSAAGWPTSTAARGSRSGPSRR